MHFISILIYLLTKFYMDFLLMAETLSSCLLNCMLKISIGFSLNCPVIDLVSLNCKIKSDYWIRRCLRHFLPLNHGARSLRTVHIWEADCMIRWTFNCFYEYFCWVQIFFICQQWLIQTNGLKRTNKVPVVIPTLAVLASWECVRNRK